MTGPDPAPETPRARRPANWGSQPLGLWWVLPLGLAVAVVVLFNGGLRASGYVIAGTLALCALLRLVVPRGAVGGLVVRSRAWDVLTLLALAVGIAGLSATLLIR
ncbi:DUF3017 domain-containing protein [Ornithinimicrobium cavernae]|uniref:DUF3017 domain-containing protein n=1 Tax=Ornithinimicrobium cavernae TaxID=2666047 RepID=UPI00137ADA44|nr:DUF3017 domain-containing protein [Ornithinimicrobium cavernae]